MTLEQSLTHHEQMSSLAFGHLELRSPDEINDSLFASGHSKLNTALRKYSMGRLVLLG